MQLSTARQEVAAQLGLDYTNSDTATLIDRWLNLSYKDIVGDFDWSWLQSREAIAMETDYTTGTVDVNAASTSITFSTGPAATQANRYIQFSSADDWYKITAHTAGSTSATIDPAYVQTSNLTAGTLTIRTVFYSMSSACEKIYSVKEAVTPQYLTILSVNTLDRYDPFSDTTGEPRAIILWSQDSDGYWTFTPHPFPDQVMLLEFRTYKKLTELSSDSDSPLFPTRFDSIWLDGAKANGYEFLDDNRANPAFNRFYARIDRLKKRDDVGLSKHRVLQPVDTQPVVRGNIIPFPSDFGDIK